MTHRTSRYPIAKHWRRLIALVFAVALVAAACGDGGDDTTTTTAAPGTTASPTTPPPAGDGALAGLFPDGMVTIGIANEVPYGYEDANTGEATGEAPEVAKAILGELGITDVDAVVVEFGALIPGLQAGQYDMIAAGMFITPERAEQIIFSDPDYCGATAFAVPAGNPKGLSDFGSIASGDAIVGVLSGAVEEGYALDSGVPDDRVSRFGDTPSVFDALVAGRIDAVALTDVTVAAQVAALDGFESTPGFIPVINGEEQLGCGGFGFIDQQFRDIFNAKLKEFQAAGMILPIVEPFGFSATAVDKAASLTVADLAAPAAPADLSALFPDGMVTIGIANEVPYGYEDANTGEATGEAPEVAKAILAELGITNVDAVVVEFGALIPGLQAGQYDMIAAGMFITPERAEQIIFSDPDYCGATAFAVPAGNPKGLSDFGSIASGDAIVGVISGAVEEGYALDSGVPDDRVSRFGDTPSVFDALVAGRIDAVALTDVTVAAQVAALDGFESTPGFIPVINGEEQLGCGGFGFIDQQFRDIFNAKLKEFQAAGMILPIVEPFGFSATAVDKAASLTVADLAG